MKFWSQRIFVAACPILLFGGNLFAVDGALTEEDVVTQLKWQLEQRVKNVEQQLGKRPEVDLDVIEPSAGKGAASALEDANEILKESEAIAYGAWLSNPLVGEVRTRNTTISSSSQSGNIVTAEVAGNKITASNLGVILDVSGSMASYLDALRAEILKSYPDAHFVEIVGCRLDGTGEQAPFYSTPGAVGNPFDPRQFPEKFSKELIASYTSISYDAMSAFRGLIENRGVDSVFWFCDLRDGMTEDAIEKMTSLIQVNSTQIFVSSLSEDAPEAFKTAVESKDGHVIVIDGKDLNKK